MALSPEDEEIATQYRKMLSMGLPEGAVMQKMAIGGVPQHIQDSVLGGEDSSSDGDVASDANAVSTDGASQDMDARRSSHNRSTNSFWEEVVEEDDESIEEEVVDEDDESGEYEEESIEEEVVDHSEYDNQEGEMEEDGGEEENQEEENQEEENQSSSEGVESTGAVPVAREVAQSNAANEIVYDPSGADLENQQQEIEYAPPYRQETYQPPPTMAPMNATVEKPLPSPKKSWFWIVCLVLFLLVGAGAGGGYWLTTLGGDDVSILKTLPRTNPPTEAPSTSVSTEFDAVQGNCNFGGLDNPNPIDQCDCFGEITDLETDVRDRYLYNRENFIPEYVAGFNEEISSCSPANQALVWVSSGDDTKITKAERAQKFALATVFASLGGSQWKNSTKWLANGDVCTWYGVECIEESVTQLVLNGNNLVGKLPSELSILETLQFLTVARNEVSGEIPESLFSIPTLGTLDVSFNSISGAIPPAVEGAVSLNSLNVESNAMVGRLTKSIGKVSNLGILNVRSNGFVSELPMELFDLESLRHLDVGDNDFTGSIPGEVAKLKKLEVLALGPNLFTGTIPLGISSLGLLKYLSLSGIEGLSGRIPAEFGFQLNNLEEIEISETNVSGNIDTSFGRLPSLKSLNFSNNQLRSAIPSELGNLKNLETLDLGNNFLDGQIPDAIGNISTLKALKLNGNLLRGGIPISFGSLSSLETMRLEANKLEDRVADEICDLREDGLDAFVVDCPIEISGETFGVVCSVPECCTACVDQE